ncbi:glycosyltransferase family 8 protein [Helicobacter pylori]|uniref:glycosyltransferase family 8 protein n=1 Tax=Helicobacter pylori TaxID=210 RepID=UPI000EB302AE|nr:glycosyltransferase [Helicobacter pylori]
MQEIIPIVVAFDNNYCIPAGVSLFSMLANAKRERERVKLFYKIHCLVEDLSAENIAKLEETIAPFSAFSSIEFLDISNEELEPRHNYYKLDVLIASEIKKLYLKLNAFSQKRFSKMIMCRFFFASLFPQYEKIIMFDVDTLFVNDISESFFIPLETHYFGAVREKDLIAINKNSAKDLYELRQMHAKSIGVADAFPNLEEAQILFDNYFNAPFLDHLFESLQNRDKEIKEIHALNKILSFSDKRHSFEFLLPRLSSKLLIGFLLFKAKQKVKRLIKRVF